MSNPFETETISAPLATQAQINFYRKLAAENFELVRAGERFQALSTEGQKVMGDMFQGILDNAPQMSKFQISQMIDKYKTTNARLKAERPASAPAGEILERGVYRTSTGKVFRVYKARMGSHMLAAEITEDGPVYVGRADRFVKPTERVSLEDAASYGRQFGICCMCGADLEDPTSVAAGIGPVCAGKY